MHHGLADTGVFCFGCDDVVQICEKAVEKFFWHEGVPRTLFLAKPLDGLVESRILLELCRVVGAARNRHGGLKLRDTRDS